MLCSYSVILKLIPKVASNILHLTASIYLKIFFGNMSQTPPPPPSLRPHHLSQLPNEGWGDTYFKSYWTLCTWILAHSKHKDTRPALKDTFKIIVFLPPGRCCNLLDGNTITGWKPWCRSLRLTSLHSAMTPAYKGYRNSLSYQWI